MFLIIYADNNEKPIINWKLIKEDKINNFKFCIYEHNNKKIILVKSGIGIALASACAELFIYYFKPKIVFNFGAVGGSDQLNILDIIVPRKIYYHDVKTPWYPRGQVPNQPKYYINDYKDTNNINLATGMTFIDSKILLKEIKNEISVDIFDMEAAGIAQICFNDNVRFICVKSISDLIKIEDNNKYNINKMIKKAGEASFIKLENIINSLITE